ncbi:MAG TPA: pyruvate dehydrogenase complex dihydrolipoamide acetyltransferase [Rhizobiales bacterium]|nr:dihydrolipoyllysine-residue acetyltransferase component of pyruvate dehydrogenase complex [bacterium BMS3Bbin10]HDO51894.1 pyruvate dehydrogenase complex dihydrolipoamide acetyltransferase [Hyphomicrobiales bacterium]
MPIPILMPALSPTMEDGKLAKWLVKEGDRVQSGDVLAEIETDKATMEVEAVDEGVVGKILVGEGTEHVAVNKAIAVLLEEGEDSGALQGFVAGAAQPAPPREEAAASSDAGEGVDAKTDIRSEEAPAPESKKSNGQAGRIFASPLARRLAQDANLDLSQVEGSGPHGRIVKLDVEKAISAGGAPAPTRAEALSAGQVMPARTPSATAVPAMPDEEILALYEPGTYEVVPHSNMRRIIASRLTLAKSTIPHFYLSVDCRLDALLAARKRLNAMSAEEGPSAFKISVNDMIIKAMAMALQKVPEANATWTEEGVLLHRSSDIGVAVSVDGGLFTPVIHHGEVKSLSEISNEMKDLAGRARNRRLAPHEYQGGATSISNLGMMGIKSFDAVINPPHSSILAVGAGEKRPVITNNSIEIATIMSCTLSCDHRVIDGALGARLLDAFKGFIEEPVTMLV